MAHSLPVLRSDSRSVRLPFRLVRKRPQRLSRHSVLRALRILAPTLFAATLASAAHAQGTMDFSGAQTLMGTFKTFAMYAGAVICLGGLIFAGVRIIKQAPASFSPAQMRVFLRLLIHLDYSFLEEVANFFVNGDQNAQVSTRTSCRQHWTASQTRS